MQHPSLQNVRIRSTRDALHVFYAVARNIIPLITRRLDAEERRAIVPGNVYVWEERSANSEATGLGMERWSVPLHHQPHPLTPTPGQTAWAGAQVVSAMCVPPTPTLPMLIPVQDFLFYHQKECDLSDDPATASTPWAQMIRSVPPSARSHSYPHASHTACTPPLDPVLRANLNA